jgi:hypothetical protein
LAGEWSCALLGEEAGTEQLFEFGLIFNRSGRSFGMERKKAARLFVCLEQEALHFPAQGLVVSAGASQAGVSVRWSGQLEGGAEDGFDSLIP